MQHRNKEKQRASQEYQAHCAHKPPNKNKEHPQQSFQFYYGEKFLWLGVPQQTDLTPEIHLSQYAIEIKCLTLKDQTSYLIPDS